MFAKSIISRAVCWWRAGNSFLIVFWVLMLLFLLMVAGGGCDNREGVTSDQEHIQTGGIKMKITSSVFDYGHNIPVKYTGDGVDVSPPLSWVGVPEEAKSIVIIADDPDAPMGTWVHWVIFNIPAEMDGLDEGVKPYVKPDDEILQGKNDFGKIGYGGPMPPKGLEHRYFFKIYALDSMLSLESGVTKQEVINAMQGHILAEGELMGTYQR